MILTLYNPRFVPKVVMSLSQIEDKKLQSVTYRHPELSDANAIWKLIKNSPYLDLNSEYCYMLLCKQFSQTCMIAESNGELAGLVTAYIPPKQPNVLFIWQVAVDPKHRGKKIASTLLKKLYESPACKNVQFLETTVTPTNEASLALFHAFARKNQTQLIKTPYFTEETFSGEVHEPEDLLKIGPLSKRKGVNMDIFDKLESNVRGYCRDFPTVFTKAQGSKLIDQNGKEYIDLFAGAGALNYGHNNPSMKKKLLDYIENDGVIHGLDMMTEAKARFLTRFEDVILKPRNMKYKMQFTGPTGTNSVEAALKLARKVTGRDTIISFTNGFHGMTLGSLSVTGNAFNRNAAGVTLNHTISMPFDGYFGDETDTIEYMDRFLQDNSSGVDVPAAVIVETVQAEGGVNVASTEWLKKLERLCRKYKMLLIVDDIQAGCGRTGTFFSFENSGIEPDMICLSKSLSGYGLPMAIVLMKPELDQWKPGEHNGTFRGNNVAFVTAAAALDYWENNELSKDIANKHKMIMDKLGTLLSTYKEEGIELRGNGLIIGVDFHSKDMATAICEDCFENGVIIENCGPQGNVVKLLPALTIDIEILKQGLDILCQAIERQLKSTSSTVDAA